MVSEQNGQKPKIRSKWNSSVLRVDAPKTINSINSDKDIFSINRILRVISRSSRVMMQASDVTKYAEEVCQIIIENCGYKMVWIGFAENDENKTVRPVAYSGFEQGYLETLGISWADTERGRGPTGTAIRTGQPSFCKNMLTDPAFKPWRQDAIKRGYASSLVLPLITSAKAFGAISIYSKEPDAFSEDEVSLLSELANDLAFGIETIRVRAAHAQAEEEVKKLAKFPDENPFPVLRLSVDGVVLYSNSPGRALLKTWRCDVGQKVPKVWRLLAKESILSNSCHTEEMSFGDRIFSIVIAPIAGEGYVNLYGQDITGQKQTEQALLVSEQSIRKKLESILSPEGDIGTLELEDIIDVPSIQHLMDDFHQIAHIPVAIIDMDGKVLVGAGWQDICIKFHRINPQTCKHCIESDVELSAVAGEGEFKLYKCKNNMWDSATPIIIGDKKMGNLFMGQFFFDDETLDYELFRAQARQYGFNEKEYIAALEKAPRISRKTFDRNKAFLYKFARKISLLSYSNIKLARMLSEREELTKSLQQSRGDLKLAQEVGNIGSWRLDVRKNELTWSDENHRIFGISKGTPKTYETFFSTIHPDDREYVDAQWQAALKGQPYDIEHRIVVNGRIKWVREKAVLEFDKTGALIGGFGTTQDITDIKQAEETLALAHRQIQSVIDNTSAIVYAFDLEERFVMANTTIAELLNSTPERMIGKRRHEFMPKEDADWHEANDRKVIEMGRALEFEEHSQLKGRSITWLTTKFPLRDAQERIYAVAGISADISERKQHEDALIKISEELCQLNNELEARVKQRTTDLVKTVNTLEGEVRLRIAAEDAQRTLTTQLQLAEEQERRRIAQDLHDSIGQILAFSLMKISSIRKVSPEEISKSLEDVSLHLKEAVTQARNLSFDLSPSILYDLGFEVAVEDLVERFARERKIPCHFENCKMPKPLDEDVKVLLYRSVRELLINAAKHSRAKEIKVSLLRSSSDIYIIVEDNGHGFDASVLEDNSKQAGGFGLFSIRERLNTIGGSFKIESDKGKGTKAALIAPLDLENKDEENREGLKS